MGDGGKRSSYCRGIHHGCGRFDLRSTARTLLITPEGAARSVGSLSRRRRGCAATLQRHGPCYAAIAGKAHSKIIAGPGKSFCMLTDGMVQARQQRTERLAVITVREETKTESGSRGQGSDRGALRLHQVGRDDEVCRRLFSRTAAFPRQCVARRARSAAGSEQPTSTFRG